MRTASILNERLFIERSSDGLPRATDYPTDIRLTGNDAAPLEVMFRHYSDSQSVSLGAVAPDLQFESLTLSDPGTFDFRPRGVAEVNNFVSFEGNAVTELADGSLVMVASLRTEAGPERDTSTLWLMRVDAIGRPVWRQRLLGTWRLSLGEASLVTSGSQLLLSAISDYRHVVIAIGADGSLRWRTTCPGSRAQTESSLWTDHRP
ncbi:MAG: hypothetical protein AAGA68_25320 [Pseudomonadota bacterium]